MYNAMANKIFAPLMDIFRGTETMKCLMELEKSQWWPMDRIRELQNERLRRLVRHAYDKVPYYHRIFEVQGLKPDDIQNNEDLVKLPVLTKQVIRNNFNDLIAREFPILPEGLLENL
jgi:phenylacetate-CoA ligase